MWLKSKQQNKEESSGLSWCSKCLLMHSNIYPVYNALEPARLHTASVTWKGWQYILLDKVSYLWSHTFRREQMGCVWVRKVTKPIWAPSKPRVSQELELEYGSELQCITEFYPFLIFKFLWKNWAEKLSTVLAFSTFISSTLRKSNLLLYAILTCFVSLPIYSIFF